MKKNISIHYVNTPYGELVLGSIGNKLCLCDWRYRKMREWVDERIKSFFNAQFIEEETAVISLTKQQLQEYFASMRTSFQIPIAFAGSQFQINVWNTLTTIPFGETRSYLALARAMNNEKAIRAIASANGANALAILIPCHRIIGSKGELVGYAGGLVAKQNLLKLEAKDNYPKQQVLF